MLVRSCGDELRDLCIVHALGEADADRGRRLVTDECRRRLETLARAEEHEGLACGSAKARVTLGDRGAGKRYRAIVAELAERDERRAPNADVARSRRRMEHVERAE